MGREGKNIYKFLSKRRKRPRREREKYIVKKNNSVEKVRLEEIKDYRDKEIN